MSRLTCAVACAFGAVAAHPTIAEDAHGSSAATRTPIEHLVVIFQENVSFDHYFATYPNAANPSEAARAVSPADR